MSSRLHDAQMKAAQRISTNAAQTGLLQRRYACGQHTPAAEGMQCPRKKSILQRSLIDSASDSAPPIVHEVLRSPGKPLDVKTRSFMEPRFGHDFSSVRVHNDAQAAKSAREVNALAYTVGRDIVFGVGQYTPETNEGQRLLAHELAHTVQQTPVSRDLQGKLQINSPGDGAEQQVNSIAEGIMTGRTYRFAPAPQVSALQRKMVVDKPKDLIPNPGGKGLVQNNAKTIENYLTALCPTGSVTVNKGSGAVNVTPNFCTRPHAKVLGIEMPWTTTSPAQASKTPTGCGCICDMANSSHLWKIVVDDKKWPGTIFDDDDAANGLKPGGSGGMVTAPSPNSPKLWGAGTVSGKQLDIDPWLVLGHELCGHGWLGDSGRHGPDVASLRGEGGHQATVARENLIRREHGIELRGTFRDPDCGESYWRDKKAPGTVNWSMYRAKCQKWRDEYNKKHGTKYKISDKIP